MARPISPVAIRRNVEFGPIEVLTKGGMWLSYSLLSDASNNAVLSACLNRGYNLPMPNSSFYWELDRDVPDDHPHSRKYDKDSEQFQSESNSPSEPTDEPSDQESDSQDDKPSDQDDKESDSQSDKDSDDQSDDDKQESNDSPNKEDNEVTIEDIIRKIAGELDDTVRADLSAQLEQRINDALADFEPKSESSSLRSVTTRIEIVERDQPTVQLDGIFHHEFPELLQNCRDGIHTYLPGPPGSGKSHAAEAAATAMGWRFASLSLGPTTPESRIWGGMDANGKFFEPAFVQGVRYAMENPESGFIWTLDEMDNGHAGILATQNSAMANGWFTAPNGDRLVLGRNVVFVGAANTFGTGPTAEFAGRNKLDPATLDRFTYLPWDTDLGMEAALVRNYLDEDMALAWLDVWQTVRNNVAAHGLKFFVTMRGCLNGARIIAGGRDMNKALMLVLGNKIPADQWAKVNPL